VSPGHEHEGLDVSEHGVDTYPEFGGEDGVVADGGTIPSTGRIDAVHRAAEGGENE
jgi:Amt family ammonium transporter